MRRATTLTAATVLFVAAFAFAVGTAGADPVSQTFTPGTYTFVVPAGVTSITVDAAGGQGGSSTFIGAVGGRGGRVSTTLAVTPGDTLDLAVGAAGVDDTSVFGPGTGGGATAIQIGRSVVL